MPPVSMHSTAPPEAGVGRYRLLPIGARPLHVAPSSSDTATRMGYKPEKTIRRFLPLASTTR
mgnify:CR=1 FL=1